jgi:hypothetical protein
MHPETFIPRFPLFILFVTLTCCHKNFGIVEKKEALQSIRFSKADSLTIDSLMAYCYHSGSKYKGVWVMQGTAFYLTYNQKVYLFSALHNFTGIDPETNERIEGLAGKPEDLLIWQLFQDRSGSWIKYFNSTVRDPRVYSKLMDTYRIFRKSPDAGKDYKLYNNNKTLFIGGKSLNAAGFYYDVGAYDISDNFPLPKHVLDFHQNGNSDLIHVGDTVFYWGLQLMGNRLSDFPGLFVGKITNTASTDNPYIVSDVFSRAGTSGSAVFKISNHKVSLLGVIARGNADKNIVYISPLKEAIGFLKL